MSDAIERVVNDYMDDEKKEAAEDKKPSNFPSDTVSVARDVDDALDKLKYTYGKLRDRLRKDSSLAGKVEDLMENEVRHIIKPY